MGDLPAFLLNFSNSARVTFFWATIWKSEAQGGVRTCSPEDPNPALGLPASSPTPPLTLGGLVPQTYHPGHHALGAWQRPARGPLSLHQALSSAHLPASWALPPPTHQVRKGRLGRRETAQSHVGERVCTTCSRSRALGTHHPPWTRPRTAQPLPQPKASEQAAMGVPSPIQDPRAAPSLGSQPPAQASPSLTRPPRAAFPIGL